MLLLQESLRAIPFSHLEGLDIWLCCCFSCPHSECPNLATSISKAKLLFSMSSIIALVSAFVIFFLGLSRLSVARAVILIISLLHIKPYAESDNSSHSMKEPSHSGSQMHGAYLLLFPLLLHASQAGWQPYLNILHSSLPLWFSYCCSFCPSALVKSCFFFKTYLRPFSDLLGEILPPSSEAWDYLSYLEFVFPFRLWDMGYI